MKLTAYKFLELQDSTKLLQVQEDVFMDYKGNWVNSNLETITLNITPTTRKEYEVVDTFPEKPIYTRIKELQSEFSINYFRNYDIEKEVKVLLQKVYPDKTVYINRILSIPSISINNKSYQWETYGKKLYAEYSPPCFRGTSEKALIEHNIEQMATLEAQVEVGQKLYQIFNGRELLPYEFNLLCILNDLKESK